MISFEKVLAIMEREGDTFYTLRKDEVIGTATITKLQKNEGNIETGSINKLCKRWNCQPGDLMEYIEGE